MQVLALDIGNSAVKGALVGPGDAVAHAFRVAHDAPGADAALRACLAALPRADAVAIASVVPARTDAVARAAAAATGRTPLAVHAGRRWPFTIGYATPHTLGADRLAAVCGALDLDSVEDGRASPLVVVDAGTAVTVEAVGLSASGGAVYLGGGIAPGPVLMAAALARGTAQLPALDLAPRLPGAVGRSTAGAIEAGVLHVFAHGVAGLVGATQHALAPDAPGRVAIVTTGGWAPMLADAFPAFADVRPHLVLVGIARAARLAGAEP